MIRRTEPSGAPSHDGAERVEVELALGDVVDHELSGFEGFLEIPAKGRRLHRPARSALSWKEA